ncbi:MAG TPA: hypothetical protein VGZ04_11035 [Acidimicrobiales bacterium]|jgi:hypothetical protein|nr:hypothetical protein [Acidimicrobiales bacterium]
MNRVSLNHSQRIVVVVGAGIALYFFGVWAMTWGLSGFTGWTRYAPLQNKNSISFTTSTDYLGPGLHPWVRLIIWLILVAVWAAFSLVTLRSATPDVVQPRLDD